MSFKEQVEELYCRWFNETYPGAAKSLDGALNFLTTTIKENFIREVKRNLNYK